MSSKRYKKLPENTNELAPEKFDKILNTIKANCTTKFDESVDLSLELITNKKKMKLI